MILNLINFIGVLISAILLVRQICLMFAKAIIIIVAAIDK